MYILSLVEKTCLRGTVDNKHSNNSVVLFPLFLETIGTAMWSDLHLSRFLWHLRAGEVPLFVMRVTFGEGLRCGGFLHFCVGVD